MPSTSLGWWQHQRMPRLIELDNQCAACLALVPPMPNLVDENLRGFVLLLSAHFQGFCRDLPSECVDELARAVAPATFQSILRAEFLFNRSLDRGNASPGTILMQPPWKVVQLCTYPR